MSRIFISLFFILAISTVAVLSHEPDCPCKGKNEVWTKCGGRCQHTCANPYPICPFICIEGCVCEPTYLRDENGECIPEECCESSEESSDWGPWGL
ncbi:chymotrypsin inhibitor-like [Andrena cerasifolii]|uniref:chymotrypsin inhibitor-like n=1 Tax=Andrena cerasifolii TaxID=2819439 RepID=UPI004037803B